MNKTLSSKGDFEEESLSVYQTKETGYHRPPAPEPLSSFTKARIESDIEGLLQEVFKD